MAFKLDLRQQVSKPTSKYKICNSFLLNPNDAQKESWIIFGFSACFLGNRIFAKQYVFYKTKISLHKEGWWFDIDKSSKKSLNLKTLKILLAIFKYLNILVKFNLDKIYKKTPEVFSNIITIENTSFYVIIMAEFHDYQSRLYLLYFFAFFKKFLLSFWILNISCYWTFEICFQFIFLPHFSLYWC